MRARRARTTGGRADVVTGVTVESCATPVLVARDLVEPVTCALLGVIDVDGGATSEQLAMLGAVVTHLWERPDLDLAQLVGLGPEAAAVAVTDPSARRRLGELMVTLEFCRHPESAAQVERVERYAGELGWHGPDLEIARTWIDEGIDRAAADFERFYAGNLETLSEPSLRQRYLRIEEPDPDLAQRLEALHDQPEGTLGHVYIEFYRRNNITVPGADVHTPAHYVSHDMNHVISGYEPTGPGEIALGAFTLAMNDNDGTGSSSSPTSRSTRPASCITAPSCRRTPRSPDPAPPSCSVRRCGAARNATPISAKPTTSRWPSGRSTRYTCGLRCTTRSLTPWIVGLGARVQRPRHLADLGDFAHERNPRSKGAGTSSVRTLCQCRFRDTRERAPGMPFRDATP